jgi:hypothetical protein
VEGRDAHRSGGLIMKIATIGLDLAKNVLQVHGVDSKGHVVVRKQLRSRDVLPYFAKLEPCEPPRVLWRLQLLREMVWTPPSRI